MPQHFVPFTLTHAIVVIAFLASLSALCVWARRAPAASRRSAEIALGSANVLAWFAYIAYWFAPARFSWERALPLHLCDLAAIVAPLAMVLGDRARWLRTLTFYWGLVLSSQAFITPTLTDGPADLYFWIFWYQHAAIVGGAVYEIAARHYHPTARDFLLATALSLGYLVTVLAVNIGLSANYGYVGPSLPLSPTVLDALGPWPPRVLLVIVLATAAFAIATPLGALAARALRR